MTPNSDNENPVISRITLALFEDSGWYLPNYDLVCLLNISWGNFITHFCLPFWHSLIVLIYFIFLICDYFRLMTSSGGRALAVTLPVAAVRT